MISFRLPFRSISFTIAALLCFWIATVDCKAKELAVGEIYEQHCLACHSADMRGGLGGSLLNPEWQHVTDDLSLRELIEKGLPDLGMQGFSDVLSDKQIQALVTYIEEKRGHEARQSDKTATKSNTITTEDYRVRIESIATIDDDRFWGVDTLPNGDLIVTGFQGNIYLYDKKSGKLGDAIQGTPKVWRHGQGGLMDVGVHPDHAQNGWIYLAYSSSNDPKKKKADGMTAIVRGKIKDGRWTDQEDIFRTDEKFHSRAGVHFGCRLVFDDGYLFFGIGDRGQQDKAQDLKYPFGKIHRIHDDGRIPEDNPFADQSDAYPTIWTYGNRNPQGLALHPLTGEIWETEHGPRGGDELNLIKRGANYGWPVITYGMNYSGTPITGETHREGMEQPVHYWVPSIAICGMTVYSGDRFSKWNGDIFVTGLKMETLQRIRVDGSKFVELEEILTDRGRVRDVHSDGSGYLYLLIENQRGKSGGEILRLSPAE